MFAAKRVSPQAGAVIVSAGSASRMQGMEKQHLLLQDRPVVVWSLLAFERHPAVGEIVLVCREQDIPQMLDYARLFEIRKLSSIVKGGASRQESVFAGVSRLSQEWEYLAIHDGARPFVTQEVITRCLQGAARYGACTAGVKVRDTIKEADPSGRILHTPPRDTLWNTQTPQVFQAQLYRDAMRRALETGEDYTDDCQLVEAQGQAVYFAQGDENNIKITYPEDICIAEAIAAMREGEKR